MALFTTSETAKTPTTENVGGLSPDLQRALARVTEIGSLPEITAKIVEVVEGKDATVKDIQEVVESDPSLTARILKIVNSAFYGLPSQIASLDRAIMMLGLSSLKNLALAASMSRLLKPGQITDQFSTHDLWRHCLAVGVCSKALASAARLPEAGEAFVAGLVHDIGLLVLRQILPDKMKEVVEKCARDGSNYCATEREIIGADHQLFGNALAGKWKFPPALRSTIAYHHDPSSLQPDFQRIAAVVYIADAICCGAQHGMYLTAWNQKPSEWMLELLKLSPECVSAIADELPTLAEEAEQVFSMGG